MKLAGRLFLSALAGGAIFLAGLAWFVATAPRAEDDPASADAVVALTGGRGERLRAAGDLSRRHPEMDVFISGVGPLTTREEILTLMGEDRGADAERVAIGREARDTRGNAREVAQWLEERGHRRVIVVTSDFHMRRALWELTRARPDLAFIPHPAPSPDVAMARWWRDPKAFRRAASEFSKYAFVRLTAGAPS